MSSCKDGADVRIPQTVLTYFRVVVVITKELTDGIITLAVVVDPVTVVDVV